MSTSAKAWRCSPSSRRSRRTAWPPPPWPSSSAGDDPASESPRLLSAGLGRRRRGGYETEGASSTLSRCHHPRRSHAPHFARHRHPRRCTRAQRHRRRQDATRSPRPGGGASMFFSSVLVSGRFRRHARRLVRTTSLPCTTSRRLRVHAEIQRTAGNNGSVSV